MNARSRHWFVWVAVLLVATALMLLLRDRLDKAHVALVYVLVVLGASSADGRVLGLTVSALAFLGFNFLFLPPYYTLVIADPLDWLVLVVFAITGVVAAQLLYRAQSTTDAAIARAQEVDRLAALGAETLAAASASDALLAIADVIRTTLGGHEVAIYRRADTGVLQRATSSIEGITPAIGDPVGAETVSWFNTKVSIAVVLSDGTTRLDPGSITGLTLQQIYRRLDVRNEPVGVLHVRFIADTTLTHDRTRLLDALAYYAALGVERVRLEATAEHAEAERRMESLRTALLMSVSHDLRTPLTTIKALAHELGVASPSTTARVIEAEADRLDALVGDLLDLSRLQAGAMPAQRAVNTIDDLIGAALQRAHGALTSHAVAVSLPDDMLVATFDLSHSVRVLVNLLENAAKYAPVGSAIEISARQAAALIIVEVSDEGPGVPVSEAERIFEPFYRPTGTPPDVRGTGLGLSIARGLCEAQGGWLRYRPRPGGGSIFSFALPSL